MTSINSISSALPTDVIGNIIFRDLSLSALGICSRVCKVWREMAEKQINTFSHEKAFGPKEWFIHFGTHLRNIPRLPPNIGEILSASCPILPGKIVEQTHILVLIPATINGQLFNLKKLGELVQSPKTGPATKFSALSLNEYEDKPVLQPYWFLMSQDVLEGSLYKDYKTQFKQVATLAKKTGIPYNVPTVLEAATCIFMHHVSIGKKLYGDNPWTYTRCQEFCNENEGWQLCVGGFGGGGLSAYDIDYDACGHESIGVGGGRKFLGH
jgi:hypothetical protein